MSNIEQEHFYFVDPGIGEKSPGCPYTLYQDGRDVRSFIIPPKGYELTSFKLEPFPETEKFYDGKIVAQYQKIPISTSIKRNIGKYLLTTFSFLCVLAVLAFFFTNGKAKLSSQHSNPKADIATIPDDTLIQEQESDTSSVAVIINIEEPGEETIETEEVAKEEKEEQEQEEQKEVLPIENTVELNNKENKEKEAAQESTTELEPKQESQPTATLTKEQFDQEFWDLIHHKEKSMKTYMSLYKKYKDLHLKTKEYYYLYLTILENTTAFAEWKSKLVRIPDDELQSINTIKELKQKL